MFRQSKFLLNSNNTTYDENKNDDVYVITNEMLKNIHKGNIPTLFLLFWKIKYFQLNNTSPKVYFISNVETINKIVIFEKEDRNITTKRKLLFNTNVGLLDHNPVNQSEINNESYLLSQRELFKIMADDIDDVKYNLPLVTKFVGNEIRNLVLYLVVQNYFKKLFNISFKITHMNTLISLLDSLEESSGKHNISLYDFLNQPELKYNEKYIFIFNKLLCEIHNTHHLYGKEEEQIMILTKNTPIYNVLSKHITKSITIIRNMLSWIDNMLNIVNTIVNYLVTGGTKSLYECNALGTLFMREVLMDFDEYKKGDRLIMSTENLMFGSRHRQCPSKPYSLLVLQQIILIIRRYYDIYYIEQEDIKQDPSNKSWFWNKFTCDGCEILRKTPSNQT
jgi:hypothetical protein